MRISDWSSDVCSSDLSDLDEATRKQLERGQRVTELMKQKQYAPMSVAEQSLSIYAVDKGYMDDVPVGKIGAFEEALHAHFANTAGDRKSTRLNSSHYCASRIPTSA